MNKQRSLAILLMWALLCCVGCGRKPDDAAIADSFKAQLFSDAALKSEPIGITVTNGEATLTGEVSSNEVKQKVLSMAQVTPGVVKVNDSMQVAGAPAENVPATTELAPSPTGAAPAPVAPPPAAGLAPTAAPAPAPAPGVTLPTATPPAAPAPAATANNTTAPAPAKAPPPPPQPRKIVVPEGTEVRVITTDAIDSDKSKIGSTFQAVLYAPITVGEEVVVPKNANISIKLIDAASAGKVKGKSEIQIGLDSVEVQGKQTAKKVGIGAGVGTAIGAIAGGGKGAAIGAAVGGGAGLATQAFKKGDKLQIPPETKIDFTLEKAVEITLPPKAAKTN